MHDRLFNERLPEAWQELVTLNADRARLQQQIDRDHESARASAEHEHREAIERSESRAAAETAAAREDHEALTARITSKAERRRIKLEHQYGTELQVIQEKAQHSESETRKRLEEAVWLSETVFEATEDQPQTEYEDELRTLEARRQALRSTHDAGCRLARRCRQRGPAPWPEHDDASPAETPGELDDPARALDDCCRDAAATVETLRKLKAPRLFVGLRLPALIVAVAGLAVAGAWWRAGWVWSPRLLIAAAVAGAAVLLLSVILYLVAARRVRPLVQQLDRIAGDGRRAHAAGLVGAEAGRQRRQREIQEERDQEIRRASETYEPILGEIEHRQERHLKRIHGKYPRLIEQLDQRSRRDREKADSECARRTDEATRRSAEERRETEQRLEQRTSEADTRHAAQWRELIERWSDGTQRIHGVIDQAVEQTAGLFPPWDDPFWNGWRPPEKFAPAVRFGALQVDMATLEGGVPDDPRLPLPWPARIDLPAALAFPDACSLLLEHGAQGGEEAVHALQTVMFRLLTALPPGKVRFTIVDPVGLGQNFAGFMHLADTYEALVNDRIWTESRHIEQRLADLTDHMENVIQKYLRNEYQTIAEYNERAGEIAEPYRFLVIADFPANISETAAKRLASIVSSGPRCGLYTLIALDTRRDGPRGMELGDLRRSSIDLVHEGGRFVWKQSAFEALPLVLDHPPPPEFMIPRLHLVAEAARDSSRVEVPFQTVAPAAEEIWSRRASADIRVPLGRSGATKLQHLELGRGTSQHVLIAGKTGSGKSTLLHVLITNLALWYSPEEVELYLVDFKKGVEFKSYATVDLPHARAVAIESDREFGLSVLERLDRELKRRGDRFRQHGVQDLPAYRAAAPNDVMPRSLLIIDEFQEFFIEDDRLAQEAALLLDRLVRQGRAFGMHVILGSQTLGGAYSLAKSTMGQMAVRIALQCSETDSYLIMSEDNSGARLLSRPGEAIYNDASGLVEGNSPFQVVWLPEAHRMDHLRQVGELASRRGVTTPPQIVFEGNAPADVSRNHLLAELLEHPLWSAPPRALRAWLGEAVAIKDPTAAVFRAQTGSNLMLVGQRDDAALAILTAALLSLAAQVPPAGVADGEVEPFVLLDGLPADSPHADLPDRLAAAVPHPTRLARRRQVPEALQALAEELDRRELADEADVRPVFLLILGLQRFRDLRQSDAFGFSMGDEDKPPGPDRIFQRLLRDGPAVGMHTIAWCDTATNVDRAVDRQTMREFDMRIVFQMSAADSTNLIDGPQANKLGLRHALYHSEEQGVLEKFRPYGPPEPAWLEQVGLTLAGHVGSQA